MNFQKFTKLAKFHLGILLRGIGRTIYGALITGLIALSAYGFILIKTEDGYAAVFDFIAAIATLTVALANAYFLGSNRKGGKK